MDDQAREYLESVNEALTQMMPSIDDKSRAQIIAQQLDFEADGVEKYGFLRLMTLADLTVRRFRLLAGKDTEGDDEEA
jgi:hypothetical protein